MGHSSCQAVSVCIAAAWCDVFVVVGNRIFFVPDLKGQVSQMYAAAGLHGPVPVQNCGNVRLRAALPSWLRQGLHRGASMVGQADRNLPGNI